MVIYRAELIIQTHFLLSTDQLYKRRSFIRNLKQLAHLSNLGDGAIFTQTFRSEVRPLAVLEVFCSPSAARLQFALMRTAHVH